MSKSKKVKEIRCAGNCGKKLQVSLNTNSGLCGKCTEDKEILGCYRKMTPNERASRSCRCEGVE